MVRINWEEYLSRYHLSEEEEKSCEAKLKFLNLGPTPYFNPLFSAQLRRQPNIVGLKNKIV